MFTRRALSGLSRADVVAGFQHRSDSTFTFVFNVFLKVFLLYTLGANNCKSVKF